MAKIKKLLALGLCLCMAAGITVGCGNSKSSKNSRLDSLCLHRQISLIRVYFHSYSNHLQFNDVQSRKSSKELFLLYTSFSYHENIHLFIPE